MRDFWDSWGTLVIIIWVALGSFVAGMEFADMLNPYEQCKQKYIAMEDIMACIDILENP